MAATFGTPAPEFVIAPDHPILGHDTIAVEFRGQQVDSDGGPKHCDQSL